MTQHPSLPGRLAPEGLRDEKHAWPVSGSTPRYASSFLSVRTDAIVDPTGETHDRVVVQPRGAVGILAVDADDRILLIEQYRHPVGARLLELPAGTLDVEGEGAQAAAERELVEEADLAADEWESLLSIVSTPGYSTEHWTVFRATGLHPVPVADRVERHAEEAEIVQWWIPLDDAVAAVFAGHISDAMTIAGVLAEKVRRHP
jgi:8-oxo-dGTP pyrophosphatase MutT (NUDIX family)